MSIASPSEEQIRARAYQLFVERDYQHGHDLDDWRQAEYELMQLPVAAIAQLEPLPTRKASKLRQATLASLVQAAMILGAQALPHFRQT